MTRRSFLYLALLGLLVLSCATRNATPLSVEAQTDELIYYVANHGQDERGLDRLIGDTLRAAGLRVTTGPMGGQPDDVTYLVTYVDNWAWDMRTYLLKIAIFVTDTRTGGIVAQSEMYQDSLAAMGKSYEEIVATATNQLLTGTTP